MSKRNTSLFLSALLLTCFTRTAQAQVSLLSENSRGSVYISIGTTSPSYKASTISIKQNKSGNSYDIEKASADTKTTSKSSILGSSFRIGYLFDHNQNWGVELNYDPTNYHIKDGQNVHVKGTFDGATVDKTMAFSEKNGYSYYLNGSNFILVNLTRRFGLFRSGLNNFAVDAYVKAGIGPLMPHALNTLEGKPSETSQFQYNGWNAAVEIAIRATIVRHFYLELAPKYDYASYSGVNIYDGTASQKLTTTMFAVSVGYTFATTRHNPLFEKRRKEYVPVSIGPLYPGGE